MQRATPRWPFLLLHTKSKPAQEEPCAGAHSCSRLRARPPARRRQAHPDKLTHGSAGVGSIAHLGTEELAHIMGIKLVHVPYKGSSRAFTDVLGGEVDMMLTSATFAAPNIRGGKVRALGIAGTRRVASLPGVPTFEEQGFAGYNVVDWKAVAGPRGIAPDVVAFLDRELNALLQSQAVTEKFQAEGTTAVGGTPEQMMQIVRADVESWKRVAEAAKVRIE